MTGFYLKTEISKIDSSYDTYYQPIDASDKTWKSTLEAIERELEAHFLENNTDSIVGIKFTLEIVDELPEDCEMDQ